jgi:hypothetical protein
MRVDASAPAPRVTVHSRGASETPGQLVRGGCPLGRSPWGGGWRPTS